MAGMEKLSEAILDKVRAEAADIVKNAESQAEGTVEEAWRKKSARLEEEKARLLQGAREEAARIEAQARVKVRQELSQAKAKVIADLVGRVKQELAGVSLKREELRSLIHESVTTLGAARVRLYVSPRDEATAKSLVEKEKALSGRVMEIKEHQGLGGVIVEDVEGKVRIDNTFETRLEMLLPRLLPEVGKELFS